MDELLDPVIDAPERWKSCDGITNLRDLGGYPTRSGPTRHARVYRSDSLHGLSADGLAAFGALGVTTILDLRRHDERDREPGPLACVHLELPSRRVFDSDPTTLRTRHDGERWLLDDYEGMLARGGPTFGAVLQVLARAEGPVVFHCTGGKDRTGMTAVLLLLALGVDRETVLDDYELTARRRGPEHIPGVVDLFVRTGIAREAAMGMLGTSRWAMAGALRALDADHGGIAAYLRGPCGLTPADLDALHGRLVG